MFVVATYRGNDKRLSGKKWHWAKSFDSTIFISQLTEQNPVRTQKL
jgi:hypothetical protein